MGQDIPIITHRSDTRAHGGIGLVLAGGGALGMAHVGVLKVLERARVPIDFVAGASMGSIIGAAFATGVKLPEMERVLIESDWDEIFSDGLPRSALPYRSKPARGREIYGDTKISVSDGELITPIGFVQGQRLLPVLQRLYASAPPSPVDFNNLPIPLRVVAADIETGEGVIISKGDLATAVRASMSVPGVFAPVEIEGRLLVDGGIVNNLPMDVVRGMGAERLIVVELNADLKKKEQLRSPLSIGGQIISLLLAQNAAIQKRSLTTSDILIEPTLQGYSAVDFGKARELIELGEKAANRALPALQHFSVSEDEYVAFKARREAANTEPLIHFVEVKSDKQGSEKRIASIVSVSKGSPLDRLALDRHIEEIYQSGDFASVRYDVIRRDGLTGIEVEAKRKRWLDDYFRFGAAFQDDLKGDDRFTLGASYRVNDLTPQGGWAQGELMVGFTPKIAGELYQPIGRDSPYFLSPRFDISRDSIFLTQERDIVAEYERGQYLVGAGFGRQLGRSGEILSEYRFADAAIERHIGDPSLPEIDYNIGEVALTAIYDSADNPDFPTTGAVIKGSFIESSVGLGASDAFQRFTGFAGLPFSRGRDTLLLSGELGETLGELPAYRSSVFGGFFNFSGLTQNSLVAADYRVARIKYYRRFHEVGSALLGMGFFVGGTVEVGSFINDAPALPDTSGLVGGSTFLGVDTPILPTYVGIGFTDQGERSAYFAIGRVSPQQ